MKGFASAFVVNGVLGGVRVLGAGIDFEFGEHLGGELVLGEHAFDGVLDDECGLVRAHVRDVAAIGGANPAGVEHVGLVGFLAAGEAHFVGVDDDDIVASVNVGRVGWFMASAQDGGYFYGEAPEHLVGGVNDIPCFPGIIRGFC